MTRPIAVVVSQPAESFPETGKGHHARWLPGRWWRAVARSGVEVVGGGDGGWPDGMADRARDWVVRPTALREQMVQVAGAGGGRVSIRVAARPSDEHSDCGYTTVPTLPSARLGAPSARGRLSAHRLILGVVYGPGKVPVLGRRCAPYGARVRAVARGGAGRSQAAE